MTECHPIKKVNESRPVFSNISIIFMLGIPNGKSCYIIFVYFV